MKINILGLDPSATSFGVAVVQCSGYGYNLLYSAPIKKLRKDTLSGTLRRIAGAINFVCSSYQIDAVAVEELFLHTRHLNVKSLMVSSQARGAAIGALPYDVPVFHYENGVVKKAICGRRKADKDSVARYVRSILNVPSEVKMVNDETDACAIAINCYNKEYTSVKVLTKRA